MERKAERIGHAIIEVDRQGRHHGLYEALVDLPDDGQIRQKLLDLVSERFLWWHRDLFVAINKCGRAAGLKRAFFGHSEEVRKVLNDSGVPVGYVEARKRRGDELYWFRRYFILRADLDQAVFALRRSKDSLYNNFRKPPSKRETYPYAYPETHKFLKLVMRHNLHQNTPDQLKKFPNADEIWTEARNMTGVYFSTEISLRQLGEMYGVSWETVRKRINKFLDLMWHDSDYNTRRSYSRENLIANKPSSWWKKRRVGGLEENDNRSTIYLNRKLETQLRNTSEHINVRQGLLNRVNPSFYKAHRELFVTASECIRVAGVGRGVMRRAEVVLRIFKRERVPVRVLTRSEGKAANCIVVVLASDKEKAVNALRNASELRKAA